MRHGLVKYIKVDIIDYNGFNYLIVKYELNSNDKDLSSYIAFTFDSYKIPKEFKEWWRQHTSIKLPKKLKKIAKIIQSYDFDKEYSLIFEDFKLDDVNYLKITHIFFNGRSYIEYKHY